VADGRSRSLASRDDKNSLRFAEERDDIRMPRWGLSEGSEFLRNPVFIRNGKNGSQSFIRPTIVRMASGQAGYHPLLLTRLLLYVLRARG
jgi:hypothetical protein